MDTTPADMGRHLSALSFHEDGSLILAASSLSNRYWNGSLWCYKNADAAPDIVKATSGIEIPSGVVDAKWLPKSNTICAGCDSGALMILSYEKDTDKILQVAAPETHDNFITSLSFSVPEETTAPRCITTSHDKTVRVWDIQALSQISVHKGHFGPVVGGAAHPTQSQLFASCGSDGRVILWDFRAHGAAKRLDPKLPSLPTCVAWQSGYDNRLVIGTESGDVTVVDVNDNSTSKPFTFNVHKRPINRLAFSSTRSDWLGTVSNDCTVSVSKISESDGRIIYNDERHKDFVYGLAWHPEDNRLFTCGYDTAVNSHIVNVNEGLISPLAGMTIVPEKEKIDKMEISGDSATS